jgi:hypothetical protein
MRLSKSAVALAALATAACGERSTPLPPGPNMQVAAPTSGTTCNFKSLSQLATHYFGGTEAKVVKNILAAMQSAGAFTTAAQDSGFSVMSHIAANVAAGNTDSTDASSLTNGLLACMYNDPANLPSAFPENFLTGTDPAAHGAYAVRGGAADANAVVFSRPLTSPFSGIGPDSVNAAAPWSGMLGSDPAPRRILVYGMPGSFSQTFDWRVVPRSTSFSPPAVVAVCVDPDASGNQTSLLHEQNVGLLPFVHALWLDLATCSPTSASLSRSGPLQFAFGAARWGLSLFTPATLSATNATIIDGLGGTTGGIHSEFGVEPVDTLTLTFVGQPSDVRVNQIITPPVVVQATHVTTGSTVANVAITLAAVNNNGTPAVLNGTLTQMTDYSGRATFNDLSETKTGGYVLVASGTVGGRPAIIVSQSTSARFNVRP